MKVKFYADSYKYGKNHLFVFKIKRQEDAEKLARKFGAKIYWLHYKNGTQNQLTITA